MKILLVRPSRVKQSVTLGEFMFCEPIGLEMVYGVLKDIYEIKIIDLMVKGENLEEEIKSFSPDVVGITSLCIDVFKVIRIANKVKSIDKKIITVVGGTEAYLNPEAFIHENVDHIMKYTTKENLKTLYSLIENNRQIPLIDGVHSKVNGYKSTNVFGRNEYLIPDRSSTEKYRKHYSYLGYKPCAIMETSLGCSKNCNFCLRWRIEGAIEKDISLDIIISQIKEIKEESIMFYDNDFLYSRERIEKFCDLIEENSIKKNFICYGSVHSIISHHKTIERLGKCGLRAVLVGYETFKQEEMESYKKKSTIEDNIKASLILKDIGIDCEATEKL